MSASYKFSGMAELKQRLRELENDMTDRPIKAGLRAAGKVVKSAVVAAAPYDGETDDGVHIRDELQVGRSRSQSGPGREVVTVGVKYGKSEYTDSGLNRRLKRVGKKFKVEGAAFYWKFLEFGTKHQKKQPFIRPAFEASQVAAAKAFEKSMAASIKKLTAKWGSKK